MWFFLTNNSVGFYRGIAPGVTGSLATGATYFGVIESTRKWIQESHPNLGGHWAHFIAGAVGKLICSSQNFISVLLLMFEFILVFKCWKRLSDN